MKNNDVKFDLAKEIETRTEALEAFEELRRQAADVPEIPLEEINQEIADVSSA